MSNPVKRFSDLQIAPAAPAANLNHVAVDREEQVPIGTAVPRSFRERLEDMRHPHRLNLRELLFCMADFFERYHSQHAEEFNPRSYKQDRRKA